MKFCFPYKPVITKIYKPAIVNSEKGRFVQMENRVSFGLSLCINGQITYEMNGKKYVSAPNTAIILPKNGIYTLRGDQTGAFPLINFECEQFDCHEIMVFPLTNPEACLKDFFTMQKLYLFKNTRFKSYSTFYDLLDKVVYGDLPNEHFLTPVTKCIEEHLSDSKLSNLYLAKKIGISEVYLRKLFLKQFGTTPKQYILDIRIQKAKQLLSSSPFSITAISEECGFSSLYHFCRAFKNKTGVTPTEYARQSRIYQI